MALATGHPLAHYEIREPIGKGGMGEVYRAKDSKLGRDVAIKVLPDEFAQDEERLRRFQREAKVLASLNHPNIASIYGLEQSDETHYLVLELVPGETLAERISRGPIPVDEALDIATKIAEALEEAHEQGIVHRDLKPANIKQTEEGNIKVLDFGLAKAFVDEDAQGRATTSMSPTITRDATGIGVILGTAAYMSPEQAKGRRVDKRTDIFAFGSVLYEMITGTRAFPGDDVSEVLAAIIKLDPDWSALPPETPRTTRHLLERCLRKDRKSRLRDIGDARVVLDTPAASQQASATAAPAQRTWPKVVGAAVLAGVTTGVAVWNVARPEPANSVVRFGVTIPAGDCDPRDWVCQLQDVVALSPEGTEIIFSSTEKGVRQLYRRSLDQLQALVIPGTEGAQQPFFSPDGDWIGFFAGAELKKVRAAGGAPETIAHVGGSGIGVMGAIWARNGKIVFSSDQLGLRQVRASGGIVERLTTVDADSGEYAHGWPQAISGTSAVIFNVLTEGGNPNSSRIVVFAPETGEQKLLIDGGSNPRYVSTGHVIYVFDGTLRAVAFDVDRLAVTGDPVTLLDDAYMEYEGSRGGFFDVTEEGTLAYVAGAPRREFMDSVVVWVDRDGRDEVIDSDLRAAESARISPDGTRLAFSVHGDVWIWDFARRTRSRLTLDRMENANPMWTPDSSRVIFRSTRDGYGLYWTAADGTGDVERLTSSRAPQIAQDATFDGKQLFVYDRDDPEEEASTFLLTLDSDRNLRPLLKTRFRETGANLSPGGNWLAYVSNESGRQEIYVRPFPDVDSGKWQVSTDGGTVPVWSPDGSELFYWNRTDFMRVATDTAPTFHADEPEVLFSGPYFYGYSTPAYDIAPDGSRFLMLRPIADQRETNPQINIVLNWFKELEARVPTTD